MDIDLLEYHIKPDDQLCFIRIQKTGSTTFVALLDAKFHVNDICPVYASQIHQTPVEKLATYKLFRSHYDYNIYQYLPKKPVYLTMLRHPVDRAISLYNHWQDEKNSSPFELFLKETAAQPIQDLIRYADPAVKLRICNLQTRQLAIGLGSRHYDPFTPSPLEHQYSERDLLDLAKQHLEEFAFVGITERFQESIFLLCYTFGWQPVVEYQNMRVTANKPKKRELDPSVIDIILEANQLDLELYQYATELFERRFSTMVDAFRHRHSTPDQSLELPQGNASSIKSDPVLLHGLEQHYEQRYAEQSYPRLQHLDLNFQHPISGTGWHRRNGSRGGLILEKGHLPFRWSGPGTESTLDLSLATDQDLTIRFLVTNAATSTILDSLTLKVNNQVIPLDRLLKRGNRVAFQGQIPQMVLQCDRPFTRLTFCVDHTVSLQTVDPNNPDQRVVGVAMQRIQLFPVHNRPSTESYRSFLVPLQDPLWVEAATVVQQHWQQGDRVIAPVELSEWFDAGWSAPSTPFASDDAIAWVMLHRGDLLKSDRPSLDCLGQQFRLVLANRIFWVWSRRPDLPALASDHPLLQAFWQQRQSLPQPNGLGWKWFKLKIFGDAQLKK